MSGREEEDPQKLKRIAAVAYDYESDTRWAGYWSNVLIPPHMAARNDVVDHYKRKFYQRFIDPELIVEPMVTKISSQPARAVEPPPQSPSSNGDINSRQRNSGSSSRTSGTPTASPPPNSTSLCWDPQTIQFSVNTWVLVVASLAIFPLVPKSLSNRAYRLSLLGTAFSSLYALYYLYGQIVACRNQEHGTCRLCKFGFSLCWLPKILLSPFTALISSLRICALNVIALIPIMCRSLEHVAKFLKRKFNRTTLYRKYLEVACVWVESNATTLGTLSSQAEIGLGFFLIISLFSWQRNIIQAFMYWQLLKLMYQAPATASYHQSAWAKIGRSANPLIQRYTPFLNTPISAIQKWWFR
ncbi:hypothetical protein OROGR_018231 [Orobanche gracilis]